MPKTIKKIKEITDLTNTDSSSIILSKVTEEFGDDLQDLPHSQELPSGKKQIRNIKYNKKNLHTRIKSFKIRYPNLRIRGDKKLANNESYIKVAVCFSPAIGPGDCFPSKRTQFLNFELC